MAFFLFFLVLVLAIGLMIYNYKLEEKRRADLVGLAGSLGLRFSPERDHVTGGRFACLNPLNKGDNRYAYNVISGHCRGHELTLFDYHYQIRSYSRRSRTRHYHLTVLSLELPVSLPELVIAPEGILSKVAQTLGYDDIDFPSKEFSDAFCVRSRDKIFAFDVCSLPLIEWLMQNRDLHIEIDRNTLALLFFQTLPADRMQENIDRLFKLRSLLPGHLLASDRRTA